MWFLLLVLFIFFGIFMVLFKHKTCIWAVYLFSPLHRLALGLVTLMASWAALSTMSLQFLEETLWAISAHLLHISSTSSSLTLWTRNFWKPLGSMCFVFLLLNLPQTLLSIPLGFCQLHLVLTYQSNWCWMNFLVLFFMILDFTRGLRAAMMPSRGWLPPP